MRKIIILFSILLYTTLSCTDESEVLPYRAVYLKLDLTFEDNVLKEQLAYKIYTEKNINTNYRAGYGGVFVIHTLIDEYFAFDLSCPNEALPTVTIEMVESNLYAVCPKCSTKYEIGESGTGAAVNAKKLRLQKYKVTQSGNNLYVTNK